MGTCSGRAPVDDERRRGRPAKPLSWEKALAADVSKADTYRKPPVFAVEADWMHEWTKFALSGGSPPGPIQNSSLVTSSRGLHDTRLGWVSADEWKSLQSRYGGGPALRRWTRELLPVFDLPTVPDTAASGGTVPVETLEPPLRHAAQLHEVWRQLLQGDLALELARLQAGPWAASAGASAALSDDCVSAARACISQAVAGERGAEELRAALRLLRDARSGVGEDVMGLEALVQALSVHEEAQMILSCLLEAIQSADRWSLEMWLEHAEAMGLGNISAGGPLLGPLRVHLQELASQERRALQGHAETGVESESAEGRIWRLSLVALENNDEEALGDLVAEGTTAGLDVGAAQLALEELRGRRQQEEEARERREKSARRQTPKRSNSRGQTESPAGADGEEDPLEAWRRKRREENLRRARMEEDQEAERRARPRSQRSDDWSRQSRQPDEFENTAGRSGEDYSRRTPSGAANPSWDSPSDWRTTDDFLNAWRRRQAEKERQEEQQRRRYQQHQQQSRQQQQQQRQQQYHQPRGEQQRPRQPPPSARSERPAAAVPMPITSHAALAALQLPTSSVPPLADLKAAYRKAALRCHPDRPQNRDRQDAATAEFQRVKAAFDLLAPNAR